ncbi:MAG TPA: ABC transporter ATP-binding protein [Actinomycetota bacterium]
MIELRNVSAAYNGRPVLHDLALRVEMGSWVGLIGPNGAGKTTLLRAVAGLLPHAGEILLSDRPLPSLSRRSVARLVAYVPQRPLIPEAMTVTDYVLAGRTPYISYLGAEGREDLRVVGEVLERLDLTDLAERPLGSLSGGELQRAVLGRALAQRAPVLLLDEPTSALDVGHQQQALELVDALRREGALTVLSATHDLTLAGLFADRLVLLDGGRAAAEGTASAVLTEQAIARHYGASVRVLEEDGRILVVPTRTAVKGTRR